jgi:zinc protease
MRARPGGLALVVPRERFELRCGARLVVSPRPGAPVTAVRVQVRGGPAFDPPGRGGLAFLTGRLVDQGTARYDEAQLAALIEPAGGNVGGDAHGAGGSISGDSWKLLLEVLAELAVRPRYPDHEFAVQQQRLLARLAVEQDDPRAQAAWRFRGLVYGKHWRGRPTHGTLASIAPLTAADLRAHHAAHWHARRAIIAVCGDVDPAAVRRQLDRLLGGWERGAPYTPPQPRFPSRAVRVDAFARAREQVHVYLGHLGVPRATPDFPALVVMDHILGTGPGFANRITRKLRDEQGLAYSVHADISSSAGRLPGTFLAYIGTAPEHVETAVRGFLKEMRAIRRSQVTPAELDMAKDYLLGSFALGYERAARRVSYLVNAELLEFEDDHLERLPEQYAAVTIDDVRRVARAHLFPDACCLAAGGPLKKSALRALLALP